jgi:primosomal protein N' (replication factor Y)
VGSRVKVPFGPRQVMGCVTALVEVSPHTNLKPILKVLGQQSLVTPGVLELARWIADYYCCPVEIALKSVLPEAVRREAEGWRERLFVHALPPVGQLPKLTKRQTEVWNVIEERREVSLQELLRLTGTTAETVRRLEDRGLAAIAPQITERDPYALEQILPSQPITLNAEQALALARITAAMDAPKPAACSPQPSTFLLHGVTGSGKTEVYLQAIAHALAQGKGAIVLVPEISLTPQTVERFKARFCSGPLRTLVAVLHSHLSSGERHDEWHKIRQGRARIVIGARSAIFAPVEPLGLVIVDEEHEHSYKQEEAPRYHARDVAVVRGQREGAVVVLGSATPSMESYYNAKRGKYALLELPTRVDNQKMPLVRVVDMRHEARKEKGIPIFSQMLHDAMLRRLEKKEQVILFLNRRGYSTSLQCPKCGYVAGCPNCSVALTYHRHLQRLCCHICGHEATVPSVCPEASCRNPAIRYAGLGTEKVEDTLARLFPHARVRRMDSDTLKRKDDYRRILGDFRTGKIDLLVGTQMIAKGLHFPNVTLVGIIYADLSLHQPDFRAAERTFQLLTQVSGRAGRGDVEGEVIVQAFTPFHPAIQYARRHDFISFYEQELEFRQQLNYPPLSRVALLTLRSRNEDKVKFTAEHLKRDLDTRLAGWRDLVLAGPAPAPLLRAETYYRYQIMLRTRQMSKLSQVLASLTQKLALPDDVTLTVDIDPVNVQ